MEKVTFITDTDGNEHAIIDRGNGEFTSMLKSTYDVMQAEQSTLQGIEQNYERISFNISVNSNLYCLRCFCSLVVHHKQGDKRVD